jgi:hypothetical protein
MRLRRPQASSNNAGSVSRPHSCFKPHPCAWSACCCGFGASAGLSHSWLLTGRTGMDRTATCTGALRRQAGERVRRSTDPPLRSCPGRLGIAIGSLERRVRRPRAPAQASIERPSGPAAPMPASTPSASDHPSSPSRRTRPGSGRNRRCAGARVAGAAGTPTRSETVVRILTISPIYHRRSPPARWPAAPRSPGRTARPTSCRRAIPL